uniref:Uncharacterized protein n=1 Tax=Hyaloperonospora arabidopsidis (strain Emoy2) TaxID=559515 RepID=M4C1F9_HYAAE
MDDRAAVERVKLRPRTTLFFKHDVEVANADSKKFLQPASRNFESVDAMAKPNELLQVTCAHVHPCKQEGLLKVLTFLGNPAAPWLYFIVPPDVFEGFKYQNYHTVRGEKVKVVDEKLKQYVIKVDFSHEIHPAKEVVKSRVRSREEESNESSSQGRTSKCARTGSV